MKTMILAAGRGERMRPLTDHCPKPFLEVQGKPLIVHHIERLRDAGCNAFVINLHHLGDKIQAHLADGRSLGVSIQYSREAPEALETAGGIVHALPLLGEQPFFVINGDVWTDYIPTEPNWAEGVLAHLILTRNPPHNPEGDFGLDDEHFVVNHSLQKLTFTGMAWYHPVFFDGLMPERRALAPLLRSGAERQQISGECFEGRWADIGTPERLREINGEAHH